MGLAQNSLRSRTSAAVARLASVLPTPTPTASISTSLLLSPHLFGIPLQADHIHVQLMLLEILHHPIQTCPRSRFIAKRIQCVHALFPRQLDHEEITLIRAQHRRMFDGVVLRGVPKFRLSNFAQPTLQCAQLEDSKAIATDSDGSGQFRAMPISMHCITTQEALQNKAFCKPFSETYACRFAPTRGPGLLRSRPLQAPQATSMLGCAR